MYVDSTLIRLRPPWTRWCLGGSSAAAALDGGECSACTRRTNCSEGRRITAAEPPAARGRGDKPVAAAESRARARPTRKQRWSTGRSSAAISPTRRTWLCGKRGQVITAAVATTGAEADEHLLAEVLWHHRRLSRLGVPEVVADAKYGTGPNYLYLDQSGIPAFIPTTRFGNQHTGIWGREHFTWLPDGGCLSLCGGSEAPASREPEGYAAGPLSGAEGRLHRLSLSPPVRAFWYRRALHRAWALGLGRGRAGKISYPQRQAADGGAQGPIEGTFGLAKEYTASGGRASKVDDGCKFSSGSQQRR